MSVILRRSSNLVFARLTVTNALLTNRIGPILSAQKRNMASKVPTIKLNDGNSIPVLAYGTGTARSKRSGSSEIDREIVNYIKTAIKVGYRHIDGAEMYNNEEEIGVAIRESGIPREEFFVTTKVYTNLDDIPAAIRTSLEKLGLAYVDLYLIHGPFKSADAKRLQQDWTEMEKVKASGLAKSIGVSNYRPQDFEEILKIAKVVPAVNQIEFHPYLQRSELMTLMKQHNIIAESFGGLTPLRKGKDGPVGKLWEDMAKKHGVSVSEIGLKWTMGQGIVAVTTSSNEGRLKDYLNSIDLELDKSEIDQVNKLGATYHFRGFWLDKFAPDDRT